MAHKNALKYKNETTLLGKVRRKFHSFLDVTYPKTIKLKFEITLSQYKYFHRHLLNLNKALSGIGQINISKAKYAGEYGYTLSINLKVRR